ncbi:MULTISPECIES: hypothetical protein [unclassified Acidovorax]|uniref:hypothetical protein n=2 Tax=unclassified Acidovorax TaxID=2684926 RepID=UPI00288357CB|nr:MULTISPECIES: hypothetical protein [unclassified Acidovorax]
MIENAKASASMSTKRRIGNAATLATPWALAVLLVMAPTAQARTATQERTAEAPKAAKKGSVRIKNQQNNSQETPAQRDRRLLRECKGLPNAGACRGFTGR